MAVRYAVPSPKDQILLGLGIFLVIVLFIYVLFQSRNLQKLAGSAVPTPTGEQQLVGRYYTSAEVERIFNSPPWTAFGFRQIQIVFTGDGIIQFTGKVDTGDLDKAMSATGDVSPAALKLLKIIPASPAVEVWAAVSIYDNKLNIKVSRIKIAGISFTTSQINADKIISDWFAGYLKNHPGLLVKTLVVSEGRVYLDAKVPPGFTLSP